ncbi:DUF6482 family protein [Aestuariibacter sp. AA17]|uniref:DUF6482 family protein n=1 Tax=Fluctibacter corallii TaxID=2984329 RepID=A0ABT3AB25_9ALTE|nr:DUF6482 family protein [Aestuariibacter sp. AA17]MCV2885880.1 DUF6482 family protein [Aestuariibacter sp. AA17]
MRYKLSVVVSKQVSIDLLEVQSFESNVYLVKLTINGVEGLLYGDTDSPVRFMSANQIRETFENNAIQDAYLIHQSYYDEMIGNPPSANEPMRIPFSMSLPY